jgi:hypothetical protein
MGDTGADDVPGLVITQQQADDRFAGRLATEFDPMVNAPVTRGDAGPAPPSGRRARAFSWARQAPRLLQPAGH